MNLKEKAKFRQTKVWKDFRKEMIKQDGLCALCEVKSSKPHLHHMDQNPENYKILRADLFKILCPICHDWLTHLERRKSLPERLQKLLKEFIL